LHLEQILSVVATLARQFSGVPPVAEIFGSQTAKPSRGIVFKMTSAQIFISALALLAVVALLMLYRASEARVSQAEAASNARAELAFALQRSRKEVEIDIIQVQQYLTDVSATRQIDGLGADDWEAASSYAARFRKDIAEARAAAAKLNDDSLVAALDQMAAVFPAYYAMGVNMAKEYIKDGPLSGNAAMPKFDETTDTLRKALDVVDLRIAAARQSTESDRVAMSTMKAKAYDTMMMVGAALAFLVIAVSVLILRYVRKKLIAPLTHATEVLDEMARGNTDIVVSGFDSDDEMGQLILSLQAVRRNAQETFDAERAKENVVVAAIGKGMHALAEGDLTYRINEEMADAFARLRDDFNAAAARLQDTIRSVMETTNEVADGAGNISKASDYLAKRTEHQAASLEQTTAALQEITGTIGRTAANAKEARDIVANAKSAAENGGTIVTNAVSAMEEISQSSKKIFDIVGVIDEIAFQTNLLALNAGVEAARAGDSGKGFAVVASEVRALAQRCGTAAKEIKDLISASHEQVESGVALVNQSGSALGDILEQVSRINALVGDMANVSEQQAVGIKQITTAVSEMDNVTQKNAAMVQENRDVAGSLSSRTTALAQMVAFFRTDQAQTSQKRRAA
jgi:methyl-accepting chemotaxis protein